MVLACERHASGGEAGRGRRTTANKAMRGEGNPSNCIVTSAAGMADESISGCVTVPLYRSGAIKMVAGYSNSVRISRRCAGAATPAGTCWKCWARRGTKTRDAKLRAAVSPSGKNSSGKSRAKNFFFHALRGSLRFGASRSRGGASGGVRIAEREAAPAAASRKSRIGSLGATLGGRTGRPPGAG